MKKLNDELQELLEQEQHQYELLEKKIYSEEIFIKRNKAIHAEIELLKTKIFETKKSLPKEVDYAEKIVKLTDAIAGLRDDSLSVLAKNQLLKTIV